ncbi:DUF4271 domain-containing protein [Parabacteroides sp. FAFU027]|uniref:DUF4271 domain-containing protein n=1 Tax=Parabacteroides sp. FAFU027 TaxID=2922715 RepID=UPI001FAE7C60|nr:DUF4271 domain-containing protein [Parabacteroides sp. FAFU027]
MAQNQQQHYQPQNLVVLHPEPVKQDTAVVQPVQDSVPYSINVKSVVVKKDTVTLPGFTLNTDSLLKEKRVLNPGDTVMYLKSHTLGLPGNLRSINSATSPGFSAILVFSLLLTTCAYSLPSDYFSRILKSLFSKKGNPDFFMEKTLSGLRFKTCLFIQTILLEGLIAFDLIRKYVFGEDITPNYLSRLGLFLGVILIYHLFRSLLFTFLGNIFTTKSVSRVFISEYFTIMSLWGTWLFPMALLIVLYPLKPVVLIALLVVPGGFVRIMTFLKGVNIFFRNKGGLFYIFLYLCALEILPLVALYQALLAVYTIY